jgi:uncharacterized protein (TIRG00374 family)
MFGTGNKKIPSWLLPALGYAISIVSLVWVLKDVDAARMWQDVQSLQWRWVAIAVFGEIFTYVIGAWRWNLLLAPVVRVPLWRSVQAIYVGLFANEVLPLRPGEVVRAYLLARWSAMPFSVSISSAIIERIIDGIWLMLVFFVTAAFVTLPRVMIDIAQVITVVIVLCALFLALVMFRKHHAHAVCANNRWSAHLKVLVEDLHLMGNAKTFYASAAASLPYLLVQVLPVYGMMKAYGLELGIWPALVVLMLLRIGTVVPQAPGNVGTAQAVIVLGLALFAVDKTTATGLAFMTWAVITFPLLVVGFFALALTGFGLGDLTSRAKAHMSATPPVVATADNP